ncbi:Predicted anti-sigma-YlaC factor YlaD, contains Zn-finger domain [Streptoalloteichus hindustanus]|uniref:Predicted anti-sigma-YlaC factor YlaD, contains Zn-finger domain n=1 Tax=Streptoalloteichus hindustanus TaxID=2017 RepID=A0A1M5MYX4_STRHI|nr:Predicted anti-sigma-YlaC factor YlaD, contains Zn-finger domain [Streptoalloteichus hindustanus]
MPSAEVDRHLASCSACAQWLVRAEALTRAVRVRPAEATPDLVAAVAAAVPPRRPAVAARLALAGVALAQLLVALSQLLNSMTGHTGHGGASGHLFNEGAAWNLALGLGLLFVVRRVERAGALLPVLGSFVAVLGAYSAHDLITGVTTPARVLSHAPLLVALVLLFVVHREHRRRPVPGSPLAAGPGGDQHVGDEGWAAASGDLAGGGPRPLRPTAERRTDAA